MKKLRRRNRNHNAQQGIKLLVESLEPRLVLSAIGFGDDGGLERFAREHRERIGGGELRVEIADEHRDARNNLRFERADRMTNNRPELPQRPAQQRQPQRDRDSDHHHGNGLDDHRHGNSHDRPDFEDRYEVDDNAFDFAEGEFSFLEDNNFDFDDSHDFAEAESYFEPKTTVPTLVFTTLAPVTNPGSIRTLTQPGRPTTNLTQLPQTSTAQLSNESSSSAPTLPVTIPTGSTTLSNNPIQDFATVFASVAPAPESTVPTAEVTASESGSDAELQVTTFVSLAITTVDQTLGLDGLDDIIEVRIESDNSTTLQSPATKLASRTDADGFTNRILSFSDESLWTSLREGGFIEFGDDVNGSSNSEFDFGDSSDDAADGSKDNENAQLDAFWFDFGDTRLDLIMDATQFEEFANQLKEIDSAVELADEAWLEDEGGMIVLTNGQITAEIIELAEGESPVVSDAVDATIELDIPMDADIGIFQAIEVATSPMDQLETTELDSESGESDSGAVAIDSDAVTSPAEQAAADAAHTESEPTRAAALPWLAALAALCTSRQRSRNNCKNWERDRDDWTTE